MGFSNSDILLPNYYWKINMDIPNIGDTIDNELAIKLCHAYQFDEIAARIQKSPEQFKEWEFDGASMLPDSLVSLILNMDQQEFSEVALKHDLKYAYGVLGDNAAKQRADKEFEQDLLGIKLNRYLARTMFLAVDHFGGEAWDTTFSWGFANKKS